MQFKVPQNIDMEDKLVGPLTLLQFLYVLGGGILIYVLFNTIFKYQLLFFVLAIPIALIALGLAFLKIQDQPLSHFINVGIQYLSKPKIRFWQKDKPLPEILKAPPKVVAKTDITKRKHIEKSDLDQLSHLLDTRPIQPEEEKYFGKITQGFEKIIQQENKQVKNNPGQVQGQAPRQSSGQALRQGSGQGGNGGNMGQNPTGKG